MKVGLVACCAEKDRMPNAARALYISDLFKKAYEYADRTCDHVYILSAKHGLVDPDEVLDPYDLSLNDMTKKERKVWAGDVLRRFYEEFRVPHADKQIEVVFFAGAKYREFLMDLMHNTAGVTSVTCPLIGLGIGEQKAWLKRQLQPIGYGG